MEETTFLYHIRRDQDDGVISKGYIGISNDPRRMCMPPSWDEIADPESKKRAISKALTGRVVSDETRRKLAEASTGVRHSAETKKKLSDIGKTKTGMLNNNFKGWWEVDDVRYESLTIAEAAISVKWATIRKRALSSNFENYRFIPKDSK